MDNNNEVYKIEISESNNDKKEEIVLAIRNFYQKMVENRMEKKMDKSKCFIIEEPSLETFLLDFGFSLEKIEELTPLQKEKSNLMLLTPYSVYKSLSKKEDKKRNLEKFLSSLMIAFKAELGNQKAALRNFRKNKFSQIFLEAAESVCQDISSKIKFLKKHL